MNDIQKILKQISEMTAGATGSGSIAGNGLGFANGIGEKTRRRVEEETVEEWHGKEEKRDSNWPLGTTVKDVRKKSDSPSNFGNWANSFQKTTKPKTKVSEGKMESSVKINEDDLEEEKLEPKDKKSKSDMVSKKKPDHRDIGKKPSDRDILPKLNESSADAEALLRRVREITKEIKYDRTIPEIIAKMKQYAEEHGVDIEYQIDEVFSAARALESAVYGLEEPFEDRVRDARNREEEAEYGDELDEDQHGLSPTTKVVLEKDKKC